MMANDFLANDLAIQQEQHQELQKKWGQEQVAAKRRFARKGPGWGGSTPASVKARKAARRRAKAGRKAGR